MSPALGRVLHNLAILLHDAQLAWRNAARDAAFADGDARHQHHDRERQQDESNLTQDRRW